jgi:hypothetical protein
MEADVVADIAARINVFKNCILNNGVEQALSTHVLQHDCSIVGAGMEAQVRGEISNQFHVDVASIYVVGSAKLGFSPKPGQYFKPFSDGSDIDVAIVSSELFARIWREIHQMQAANEYFDYPAFKHYHFNGWIRPDKMPSSAEYTTGKAWWDFFRGLSSREDFMRLKIRGGLYHDDYFLRQYQLGGLSSLRAHLIGEVA